MAKQILSKGKDGYQRDIGYKAVPQPNGDILYKQHRFFLGKDGTEAKIRSLKLERIWDQTVMRWQRLRESERPIWDEVTLQLAKSAARGEAVCTLDVPASVQEQVGGDAAVLLIWLDNLRRDFPNVNIQLRDAQTTAEGQAFWQAAAATTASPDIAKLAGVPVPPAPTAGPTLHEAINAFCSWLKTRYLRSDGKGISPFATNTINQFEMFKRVVADIPLSAFDLAAIDNITNTWEQRPPTIKGKRYSCQTVLVILRRFTMFINWLHKQRARFGWRKPEDYETRRLRIKESAAEINRRVQGVRTYTQEQLATLYEYATPLERVLMLLALNCGFGQAELFTLQLSEIFINEQHPKYKLEGSWIRRVRYKSKVYGEWMLWNHTVLALQWYLAQRPKSEATELLLASTGTPYGTPTSGDCRSSRIAKAWQNLTRRVQQDFPNFPALSFNKLRKTAATLIREEGGGEVAGIFVGHGRAVSSDGLLDLYANRNFKPVFTAINTVGTVNLAEMFARVPTPFPERFARRKIRLSVIKSIQQMRAAGHSLRRIAKQLGVTIHTVLRHTK